MIKRGRPQNPKLAIDQQWFSQRMKERGIKYLSDLGSEIGLTKSLITKTMTSGTRLPTASDVAGLAVALRVPTDEVMRRLGYKVHQTGIPIVGRITTDGRISPIIAKRGSLFKTDDVPLTAEALVAEVDSGPLAFVNGATFVYLPSPQTAAVPPSAMGRLCIVEADSHLTPFLAILSNVTIRSGATLHGFGTHEKITVRQVHRASPVLSIHFS